MSISKTTIGRKILMALSGFFLLFFLLQHFIINFTSVIDPTVFNELSHFMGTNALVQFLLQPVLIFGVIFHFVMGFVLDIKNRNSRKTKYVNFNTNNSSWFSQNMILSGIVILCFLGLHFYDFWVPEITYKYIEFTAEDPTRYHHELTEKFHDPIRVGIYCVSFIFLSLHLLHGFNSAFQSIGFNNKYSAIIKKIGFLYAILIPLGFIFIALFHHINIFLKHA